MSDKDLTTIQIKKSTGRILRLAYDRSDYTKKVDHDTEVILAGLKALKGRKHDEKKS